MQIAHVTTIPLTASTFLLRLFVHCRERGHSVSVLSSSGDGVIRMTECGVRHVAVPLTRRITPFRDLVAVYCLTADMVRRRYSVVHTHTPKGNLLGLLAARMARVPFRCCTIHGLYMSSSFSLWKNVVFAAIEWFTAMQAHRVFLINREDVALATRFRLIPPEKIILLEGGVGLDIGRFDPESITEEDRFHERQCLGLNPDTVVIGFAGRLVAEKGIPELLQVAERMRDSHPDVRFLFVGGADPEKADTISPEWVRRQGLGASSIFAGSRTNIPLMYSLMDVLCLPSHREGFGMVLAEASAMGLPVVASDLGGCREIVEDGVNGFLVPVGDLDALQRVLTVLVDDPGLRRQMGDRGRLRAIKRFDDRLINARIMREYHAALGTDADACREADQIPSPLLHGSVPGNRS